MRYPIFTPAALRYQRRLADAVRPLAPRLDRQFRAALGGDGYDARQIRALEAVTPAAAARISSMRAFLEQVEYNGRRLAKMNVPPGEIRDALREFDTMLDPALAGSHAPAREQLHLTTVSVLESAFHQVREAEVQAFFGLYHAESEASGLEDLLRRFVRILTRTFHAKAGRLMLVETPLAGDLARPLYIERRDPLRRLIADAAMRSRHASFWSYPIPPVAVLQFGFDTPYPWLPREQVLLEAVSARCREAIERAQLQQDVRRMEMKAHQAEEEERRRIGRELHDEAGQSLLCLRLELELLARDAPAALAPRLQEARDIAERTIAELRRIVAALGPSVLERLGLEPALRQLLARFRKMHPAQVRTSFAELPGRLPRQSEEVIYRVAQESLQNITKHSQATRVNLSLDYADSLIRLRVTDNGAGFIADRARAKPMSFGLAGIQERAALAGGTLEIRSAPGKGTRIALKLPMKSAGVVSDA